MSYGFETMPSLEVSKVAEAAYTLMHTGETYPVLQAAINKDEAKKVRTAAETVLWERLQKIIENRDEWKKWAEADDAPNEDTNPSEADDDW